MDIGSLSRLTYILQFLLSTSCLKFYVEEEQLSGAYVGQLTSLDRGGTYCFTSSCGWSHLFALDQQNGIITTTDPIDRESLASDIMTLTLSGTDSQGSNVLMVIDIEVVDINDNSPSFKVSDMVLKVSENLGPQVFDLVSWSDKDEGENGKLKKVQILDIPDQTWPFLPEITSSGNFQQVVLKVTQSLDREKVSSYKFTVEIEDNGYPELTGILNVFVDVQDVNDNAPVFDKSSYQFQLNENLTIPNVIHQFTATDDDFMDNGKVEYSLSHSYNKAYFTINKESGKLTLTSKIDYESCPSLRSDVKGFALTVSAQDLGASPRHVSVSVELIIIDANDNSPTIKFYSPFMTQSGSDEVEIPENIAVDSYAATIIVNDKDSGVNGEFDVTIDDGDFGRFKLQTSNGLLMLTADHLDREVHSVYEIVIKATDRGSPSLTTKKNLTINILDKNDNAPSFIKPLYTKDIPEDVGLDFLVLSVKATDLDNGANGSISYRIESQTGGDCFKISSDTGSIHNTKQLDAEKTKFHLLNVSASDGGNPSLTSFTVVNITVLDVNDNSPIFGKSLYSCNVPESTSKDSLICSVSASDIDSGPNGQIVFTIDLTNSRMFQINDLTGDITLVSQLDFEKSQVHKLTIKASDSGVPVRYTTCEVIINVQDVNDEVPRFDPVTYSATIPEGVIFSSILQVHATDDDKGDSIKFTLTSGDYRYFAVSPSGVISNTQVLQYSSSGSLYNFKVSAHDDADNEASPSASINIKVVAKSPDLPVFSKGVIKVSVSENSPVGHTVATVTASTESSCAISYSIDSQSDSFSIDSATGKLKIKKKIDFEVIKRIRMSVVATCRSVEGHAIVEVDVLDVNDNSPECDSMGTTYVKEDTQVGTVVHTCICRDADSGTNGQLSFSITPTDHDSLFSISTNKGELSVSSPLDRETLEIVQLNIEVCDKGSVSLCSNFDLIVRVTDVNDNAPEFLDPRTFSVMEDVKVNHAIGKLEALDKDEGRNSRLTFSVINSVPQIKVFGSGEIVVNQHLDYESFDRFFLNVRVTDQGIPSQSTEVIITIIVQDANDNAPQFERQKYHFSVLEHQSVPFIIGIVIATDKDTVEHGKVIYSLVDDNEIFSINATTGEITLIGNVDRESSVISYEFNVEASDSGIIPLRSQVPVVVNIVDINDNTPIFTQETYNVLIAEDIDLNAKVLIVSASDIDGPSNNQITYSFEEEQDSFRIDAQSGKILTAKKLDFESKHNYSIVIQAEDNGSPVLSSKAIVVILLSDVNDNTPYFKTDLIEIGVVESASPGTVIKRIKAYDDDSENNGKVTYSITVESDPGIFSLDSVSGDLRLLQKLKFSGKVYKLTVKATDHGSVQLSSTQDIEITVIDINDNAPVFTDSIFTANVLENSQKGTLAFKVVATDQDSGPAGIVNYNISSEFFSIDAISGEASISSDIDREKNASLLVTVCAIDQASPVSEQLSVCKDVSVSVMDVNDNAPVFRSDEANISVQESTQVGSKIATLETSDADYGVNAVVSYSIVHENPYGLVSVGADSGDLTLLKSLDYETVKDAGSFTIVVADKGTPSLKSSKQFFLSVLDDNDNVPVFSNPASQRSVYLPSSVTVDSVIFKATASDADSGLNGEIYYSLPNTFDGKFIVDKDSGDIRIKITVGPSFEKTLLQVEATDFGSPKRSTVMIVNVEHKNTNTKPICPSKSYTSVPENAMSYTTIFSVRCYDLDWGKGGILNYSILNGNRGNVFSVSKDGNVSLTSNRLDYEKLQLYSLVILVEDLGNPSLKEIFILEVTVTNVNDEAPVFTSDEIILTVSEGATVGSLLKTITATDKDGNIITYSSSVITEDCKGFFSLNSLTGQLTLAKKISASLMNSVNKCEMKVVASDGKYNAATLMTIFLDDIDNHAPVFYSSPAFTVNTDFSCIVGAVGASDSDSGDSDLVYMISTTKRSLGFLIDPSSGVISCPNPPCSVGDIHVKASGRIMSASKTVSIALDTSAVQKIFTDSQFNFTVKESEGVDFIIGQITVLKTPDNLTIEGGNKGLSIRIENNNLIIKKKLDYEMTPSFNLTLCAVLDSVSTFAFALITVVDVNDNVPHFLPATMRKGLNSSASIGTEVFKAAAEDADSGLSGKLLYYLEDSVFNEFFEVETQTGIIRIKKELSKAKTLNMDIQVKAKDQGSPPRTSNTFNLVIRIAHEPVVPKFKKPSYDFTAYADAPDNSPIGKIDIINDAHDDYRYEFEKDSRYFTIYSTSGIVLQKSSISDNKLETVQESVKVVSVTDPSVFGTVRANINVIQSICSPNPCKNGGICFASVEKYECRCQSGTLGKNCECADDECSNRGTCFYNSTMSEAVCLCEDGQYRENCESSDNVLLIAVIGGGSFVIVVIIICVVAFCCVRYRKTKDKKAVNTEFDNAVNGAGLGNNKRMKGQLHLQDNICMNPINISNLDMDSKIGYPEFSYTNHDYDLDSPLPLHSPASQYPPHSFQYAASDSGHSSQCTEAVIFRKLKQVDEPNSDSQRRDKDSGLAGSLNTLCHFDMDFNNEDYLQDWGPKVQNLVNVLDLDDVILDEDTPVREEFV